MNEQIEQENSIEQEAKAQGWVPQDEFKGDPSKWRSAEEFVERGKQITPILKERNEKLVRDIERLNSKLESQGEAVQELIQYYSKAEQRAYQKAFNELKTKQREAVEIGDTAAYEAAEREIDELTKTPPPQPKAPKAQNEPPAEYFDFLEENKWYAEDRELAEYADFIGTRLVGTVKSNKDFYAEVAKRVKARFPEKFDNPKRSTAQAVEGAGSPPKAKGRGYNDLPADAKAQCDRFVKEIPGFSKDEYMKHYQWD